MVSTIWKEMWRFFVKKRLLDLFSFTFYSISIWRFLKKPSTKHSIFFKLQKHHKNTFSSYRFRWCFHLISLWKTRSLWCFYLISVPAKKHFSSTHEPLFWAFFPKPCQTLPANNDAKHCRTEPLWNTPFSTPKFDPKKNCPNADLLPNSTEK